MQFTYVTLMRFGEKTTSEENLFARTETEVRVRKFKNRKAAGKDEIIVEMMKGGGDSVADCVIWPLRVVLGLKTGDLL